MSSALLSQVRAVLETLQSTQPASPPAEEKKSTVPAFILLGEPDLGRPAMPVSIRRLRGDHRHDWRRCGPNICQCASCLDVHHFTWLAK